jgi:hypothetical protein
LGSFRQSLSANRLVAPRALLDPAQNLSASDGSGLLAVMAKPLLRLGAVGLGDYAAFTDESSISGHRYMLVGGVSCGSGHAQRIHDFVRRTRLGSKYPSDSLQWKHYRDAKFDAYRRLIDFFVTEKDAQRVDFTCLVIDTRGLDHKRFNEGDGETFFQKMMCQLYLRGIIGKYPRTSTMRGFHGHRVSRYDMIEVRSIINATAAKDSNSVIYRPLRQFEYKRVEDSGPHQLTDILLGAVSYYWNTGIQRGGESRKRKLAEYVQAACCSASLGRPTPIWMRNFDIWEIRLRE